MGTVDVEHELDATVVRDGRKVGAQQDRITPTSAFPTITFRPAGGGAADPLALTSGTIPSAPTNIRAGFSRGSTRKAAGDRAAVDENASTRSDVAAAIAIEITDSY